MFYCLPIFVIAFVTESEMKESLVREVESFLQRNSQSSSVRSSQQKNFDHGLLQIPVTYGQSDLPEVSY